MVVGYRSFLWSEKQKVVKKATNAWEKLCQPKRAGGLRLIYLCDWKKVLCTKLLWNLCMKTGKLWVKWFNEYHLKGVNAMNCQEKGRCPGTRKLC